MTIRLRVVAANTQHLRVFWDLLTARSIWEQLGLFGSENDAAQVTTHAHRDAPSCSRCFRPSSRIAARFGPIVIEYRFAEGRFERLPDLAAELVELTVDVIVAQLIQASLAAKGATRAIPIVMQGVSDPVGTGLVARLAWPGANITGTSAMSAEAVGKSLELLKEVLPKLSLVAVLWNPDNAIFQAQMLRETQNLRSPGCR